LVILSLPELIARLFLLPQELLDTFYMRVRTVVSHWLIASPEGFLDSPSIFQYFENIWTTCLNLAIFPSCDAEVPFRDRFT
jgi:hypothetical protein